MQQIDYNDKDKPQEETPLKFYIFKNGKLVAIEKKTDKEQTDGDDNAGQEFRK